VACPVAGGPPVHIGAYIGGGDTATTAQKNAPAHQGDGFAPGGNGVSAWGVWGDVVDTNIFYIIFFPLKKYGFWVPHPRQSHRRRCCLG